MTPATESEGAEMILLTRGEKLEETAETTKTLLLDRERSVPKNVVMAISTSGLTMLYRLPKPRPQPQLLRQMKKRKPSDSPNWKPGNKNKLLNANGSNASKLLQVAPAVS
jgi:hypothetical protein